MWTCQFSSLIILVWDVVGVFSYLKRINFVLPWTQGFWKHAFKGLVGCNIYPLYKQKGLVPTFKLLNDERSKLPALWWHIFGYPWHVSVNSFKWCCWPSCLPSQDILLRQSWISTFWCLINYVVCLRLYSTRWSDPHASVSCKELFQFSSREFLNEHTTGLCKHTSWSCKKLQLCYFIFVALFFSPLIGD